MKRVLAIARLTFWEGVRMRVVLVLLVVLILLVLYMPFALRGDETLAGRLQNFLAYSLGALSMLLSLVTIFFSCATLTNEFKECSLHLVVTKPVTRFQILLGKWVGVNALNVLIVVLGGAAIYGFAHFISTRPVQFARDRLKVRDVVWTARHAATPIVPEGLSEAAVKDVRTRIKTGEVEAQMAQIAVNQRFAELIREWRVVPPGAYNLYEFENLSPPEREDTVVQIRYKAVASPLTLTEMLEVGWVFCDPDDGTPLHPPTFTSERSGNKHQFLVKARGVIRGDRALLGVINPASQTQRTAVVFEGEDSLQILYKIEDFEVSFVKTLLIILLRLGLLSAVGLLFGVFVSFPVACLCGCAFYLVCLGMPFWLESIGANMQMVMPAVDPYGSWGPWVRGVLVRILWALFPDFAHYDGTRHLVAGEYISYGLLGWGVLRTLVYGTGLLLLGWLVFRSREVAQVQV